MMDLLIDALRVAHMTAFAAGIGSAMFLEVYLFKRFRSRIDRTGIQVMRLGHELIKAAIVALWATGLSLIYVKLSILGDPFTPKLAAKLLVVSALTLNMVLIERLLMPIVSLHMGHPLRDIEAFDLVKVGAIAGFSGGAWVSALLLGGVGRFKAMDAFHLGEILGPILVGATVVGMIGALALRPRQSTPHASIIPGE